MRRGPHAEWPGSVVLIGTLIGVLRRSNVEAEGSTIMCERLVGDNSRWRSSGGCWSLQRVVACGVALRW
jgi:hypothetical protein